MPPIPGTTVNVTASATPTSVPSSIGTLFVVGQTAAGPVGMPVTITSLGQYVAVFGARTANGASPTLYDAIDAFFQEGGQVAIVSRVFAAAAIATDTASLTLQDKAGSPLPTLKVSALGPGLYGNSITVKVTAGLPSNTFVLTITNGSVTEISPALTSPADAVNWASAYSQTVVITNLGSATAAPNNNPANISATALASGADNTSPADSDFLTALTFFPLDKGMGQVAAPGRTTAAVWEGLITHAQAFNRFALLDGENTATAASIEADATTVQAAVPDPSYGIMLAGWPIYPGLPTTTATPPYPRVVAPSGAVAGVMAALASAGNNGDVAAAGNNGIMGHAVGVAVSYSDADRGALDAAGIGVIRDYRSNVQLYGYTSLAIDPNWIDVGNVRLRMQIIDGARQIGDGYVFADLDANGHARSAFGGQLAAFLLDLWQAGALFGQTAAEAFFVNVGASLNTPAVAQARQLLASIACRMSPTAEQVIIDVTKYPVGQALPA